MRLLQIRFRGSKPDLKFAVGKISKLIDRMPDNAGDLQDRYTVTISINPNNSHKLPKIVRLEP